MNNINNKLIEKKEIEALINKYIDIYYTNLEQNSDPFNLNRFILPEKNKVYITINNIENIQKAFIHKSFWNITNIYDPTDAFSCMYLNKEEFGDYEKSEFRGDKVIDLITLDYITELFPDKEVGFLTDLKSRIVRKESLANLGEKLGFKEYILFSSHIDKITKENTGRDNKRFLEDIFESFIGKLYIDQNSNIDIIRPFLLGVYHSFIDINFLINNDINYKTSLLKFFHSQKFSHPKYTDAYFLGPVTNREFVSIVSLDKTLLNGNIHYNTLIAKQNEFLKTFTPELLNKIQSQPDQINLDTNSNTIKTLKTLLESDFDKYINNDSQKQFKQKQKELLGLIENNSKKYQINVLDYVKELLKTHIIVGNGKGMKKQEAEQNCSYNALINFKEL